MLKDITYGSCISKWIYGFIHEKTSLGYKYYNEAKWMRQFDRYWAEHGYGMEGLTQENIAGWMKKRDSEGTKPVHTDQRHPAIRRLPDRARHRKLFPAFGHTVPKSRDPSSDRCRNQGTVWQDRCVQPQKRELWHQARRK